MHFFNITYSHLLAFFNSKIIFFHNLPTSTYYSWQGYWSTLYKHSGDKLSTVRWLWISM